MAHSPHTVPYNTPSLCHIHVLSLGHERINVQDKGAICHLNLTQTKKKNEKIKPFPGPSPNPNTKPFPSR